MSFFSTGPDATQRSNADLRLVFKRERGKTVLSESFSRMPFRVFPPFYSGNGRCAYTYIVNPTPGYLGGDRSQIDILLEPHSHAFITSPSATKILNTGHDRAEQTTHISVADGAILEYIPSYVIPFAGSRFRQRTTINIEAGSTCIVLDWFSTGRIGYGEHFAFDEYDNATMIVCGGRPLVFDRFVLRPHDEDCSALGRMESYTVSAFLCLIRVSPNLPKFPLDDIRALQCGEDALCGVSTLAAGGLAVRIMGRNIPAVQKVLFRVIGLIRRGLWAVEDDHTLQRVLRPL